MSKYICCTKDYIEDPSCIISPCVVEVADNSAPPIQCCYVGKCKWRRIE